MLLYLSYTLGTIMLTKIITKYVPFSSEDYQLKKVKKSAMNSLIIMFAEAMALVVYLLMIKEYIDKIPGYGLFLLQCFLFVFQTSIVLLAIRYEKESILSIGITKSNLLKSILLGIFLGVVFFIGYQFISKENSMARIFTVSSLLSFIKYNFVGFSEEIIYRGYVQTRLSAWLGTSKGCTITAIIFVFTHFPIKVFQGMDIQSAFTSCIILIPLSLMLGYIKLKTKNIYAPAILHMIIDWTQNI